jgi:hypothetical protein
MYPWPVGNFDYVMDEALDIAMNYLSATNRAALQGQSDRRCQGDHYCVAKRLEA